MLNVTFSLGVFLQEKLNLDLELGGNEINGDLHKPIGMAVSYLKFLKISFILNDASHCQIDV